MATIEIRDVLDNETGKTIFPRTHVDAVIGLKDFSFFEKVQDANDPTKFSVKLKSEYTGLWAEGWIAAGGVGPGSGGGGGGLITSVKGVADLGTSIPTESLTETFSAKAIESIFERVVALENATPQIDLSDYGAGLSLTKTTSASYLRDANGGYLLDANGNRIIVVGQYSEVSHLNLLNKDGDVLSSVDLDIDLSSYATRSWVQQNFLTQDTTSYVPSSRKINGVDLSADRTFYVGTSQIQSSSIAQDLTGISSVKASSDAASMFAWDEDLGAWHFYGNLYADGWVAAGGVGSGSGGGGIDLDRVWQSLTNNTDKPNVEINIAHIPTLTAAKIPDITTAKVSDINTWVTSKGLSIAGLSVNIGGSITAAALRQALGISGDETPTISSVVLTNGTNYSEITVDDTSASFYTKAQIDSAYALKTGSFTYNFQANSIIFNGGTLTGTTTMQLAHRLVYSYQEGGMSVDDPVVTVSKTIAFLDDIPAHQTVTLTGGTNNGTLKLTTAAGAVDNIAVTGLQALAYKASLVASDIPDISGTYVTVATAQTVSGLKTFSAGLVSGGDIYPSADLGGSLGYSNRRFANANIQTIGTSTIYLKNSNSGNSGLISASGGYLVVRAGADLNTAYKQLTFNENYGFYPDGTGVNLGYSGSTNRWATIYGVNGDLTGYLSLAPTSHIDIGPLRIEYDATNKALHITKKDSNDTETYGLYADGFVAAGGIQQSS